MLIQPKIALMKLFQQNPAIIGRCFSA